MIDFFYVLMTADRDKTITAQFQTLAPVWVTYSLIFSFIILMKQADSYGFLKTAPIISVQFLYSSRWITGISKLSDLVRGVGCLMEAAWTWAITSSTDRFLEAFRRYISSFPFFPLKCTKKFNGSIYLSTRICFFWPSFWAKKDYTPTLLNLNVLSTLFENQTGKTNDLAKQAQDMISVSLSAKMRGGKVFDGNFFNTS